MTTSTRRPITEDLAFRVSPIPADDLDAVRASGVDVSGNPLVHLEAGGGEPLRCCLRDAEPAEPLILFGYQPRLPDMRSPYVERGAVFAHAQPCDGPADDGYPAAWFGRSQVLRAYDERGWIVASTVHDGQAPAEVVETMLADPAVRVVHSRNVGHGCYMFEVHRTGA